MKKLGIFLMLAAMVSLASCDNEDETMYENGSYKAELAEFSHGWKEFMEVTIKGDEVTAVNFDASSEEDGSLKSSLTEYPMPDPPGLPSTWYPQLEAQFMDADITDYTPVDGISGATGTSENAMALFELILDAAKEGDTSTQILPVEE